MATAPYLGHIEQQTLDNTNYRQVLFTGENLQLVVMSLQAGDEIGEEIHAGHDQFLRFEVGHGTVVLDGEATTVANGDAVVVPAGVKHNVINTSTDQLLKLYTLYAPPEHAPGTIQPTKADERHASSG